MQRAHVYARFLGHASFQVLPLLYSCAASQTALS